MRMNFNIELVLSDIAAISRKNQNIRLCFSFDIPLLVIFAIIENNTTAYLPVRPYHNLGCGSNSPYVLRSDLKGQVATSQTRQRYVIFFIANLETRHIFPSVFTGQRKNIAYHQKKVFIGMSYVLRFELKPRQIFRSQLTRQWKNMTYGQQSCSVFHCLSESSTSFLQ